MDVSNPSSCLVLSVSYYYLLSCLLPIVGGLNLRQSGENLRIVSKSEAKWGRVFSNFYTDFLLVHHKNKSIYLAQFNL